jgi:hypothetical protein
MTQSYFSQIRFLFLEESCPRFLPAFRKAVEFKWLELCATTPTLNISAIPPHSNPELKNTMTLRTSLKRIVCFFNLIETQRASPTPIKLDFSINLSIPVTLIIKQQMNLNQRLSFLRRDHHNVFLNKSSLRDIKSSLVF